MTLGHIFQRELLNEKLGKAIYKEGSQKDTLPHKTIMEGICDCLEKLQYI